MSDQQKPKLSEQVDHAGYVTLSCRVNKDFKGEIVSIEKLMQDRRWTWSAAMREIIALGVKTLNQNGGVL